MSTIPDQIDYLNLNGIMPYDVKSFIKDGTQQSLIPGLKGPEIMTGVNSGDSFTPAKEEGADKPSKKHKFDLKMGILGASILFLAFTILGKKVPKIGEFTSKIGSNITKIFKK